MASGNTPLASNPAGEFRSLTRAPITKFIIDNIPAPTLAYVRDDAFLRFVLTNISSLGQSFVLRTRLLRAEDGGITDGQEQYNNFGGGGLTTTAFLPLTEGFLLSATLTAGNGLLERGLAFAQLVLCHGTQQDVRVDQVLFQDYITTNAALTFPGGLITQPAQGNGAFTNFQAGNPGAGNEFNLISNGFNRDIVRQVSCTFTTSAAVANRVVALGGNDGAGTFFNFFPTSQIIPASTVAQIVWFPGAGAPFSIAAGAVGQLFTAPLPDRYNLRNSAALGTKTSGIQAGDVYTNIKFVLEQLIES